MKYVVILQARTTSTRLPAKALLPIAGYPSVSLAALRAANAGGEVIVATSDDASDDALAAEVQTHQIRVVRGSLHDLLARFHRATDSLSDNDIVVRLTADNVVPDGHLAQDLASALHGFRQEYSVSSIASKQVALRTGRARRFVFVHYAKLTCPRQVHSIENTLARGCKGTVDRPFTLRPRSRMRTSAICDAR